MCHTPFCNARRNHTELKIDVCINTSESCQGTGPTMHHTVAQLCTQYFQTKLIDCHIPKLPRHQGTPSRVLTKSRSMPALKKTNVGQVDIHSA